MYDSAPDTQSHRLRVQDLLYLFQRRLQFRGQEHDLSKLEPPEKEAFDACATHLATLTYGTPEYHAALDDLKPALAHHYSVNLHHPEHWKDGVAGMSLLDIVEMLMDWKAAAERMKGGGDIRHSLEVNTTRFDLSPQLASILKNTIDEMGW